MGLSASTEGLLACGGMAVLCLVLSLGRSVGIREWQALYQPRNHINALAAAAVGLLCWQFAFADETADIAAVHGAARCQAMGAALHYVYLTLLALCVAGAFVDARAVRAAESAAPAAVLQLGSAAFAYLGPAALVALSFALEHRPYHANSSNHCWISPKRSMGPVVIPGLVAALVTGCVYAAAMTRNSIVTATEAQAQQGAVDVVVSQVQAAQAHVRIGFMLFAVLTAALIIGVTGLITEVEPFAVAANLLFLLYSLVALIFGEARREARGVGPLLPTSAPNTEADASCTAAGVIAVGAPKDTGLPRYDRSVQRFPAMDDSSPGMARPPTYSSLPWSGPGALQYNSGSPQTDASAPLELTDGEVAFRDALQALERLACDSGDESCASSLEAVCDAPDNLSEPDTAGLGESESEDEGAFGLASGDADIREAVLQGFETDPEAAGTAGLPVLRFEAIMHELSRISEGDEPESNPATPPRQLHMTAAEAAAEEVEVDSRAGPRAAKADAIALTIEEVEEEAAVPHVAPEQEDKPIDVADAIDATSISAPAVADPAPAETAAVAAAVAAPAPRSRRAPAPAATTPRRRAPLAAIGNTLGASTPQAKKKQGSGGRPKALTKSVVEAVLPIQGVSYGTRSQPSSPGLQALLAGPLRQSPSKAARRPTAHSLSQVRLTTTF